MEGLYCVQGGRSVRTMKGRAQRRGKGLMMGTGVSDLCLNPRTYSIFIDTPKPQIIGQKVPDKTEIHVETIPANIFSKHI